MHIQKTAGSSIVNLAKVEYGSENVVSHGDFLGHEPTDLQAYSFVSGHFPYSFARVLMPGRFSFTFLRDPIDRVLSLYFFSRTRDPDQFSIYRIAQETDLNEFLSLGFSDSTVKGHIWNRQVCQLASVDVEEEDLQKLELLNGSALVETARRNLQTFDHVGFMETFPEDFRIVLRKLRIDYTHTPWVNRTEQRLRTEEVGDEAMKLLHQLTSLDQRLYSLVRPDFRSRGKQLTR